MNHIKWMKQNEEKYCSETHLANTQKFELTNIILDKQNIKKNILNKITHVMEFVILSVNVSKWKKL